MDSQSKTSERRAWLHSSRSAVRRYVVLNYALEGLHRLVASVAHAAARPKGQGSVSTGVHRLIRLE